MKNPRECGDFNIQRRPNSRYNLDYKSLNSPKHDANYGLATEHVLETQLINLFSAAISEQEGEDFIDPHDPTKSRKVDFCKYMTAYWADSDKNTRPNIGGTPRLAIQWIADQFPTTKFQANEFFLLSGAPNGVKGRVSHSFILMMPWYFLANILFRHGVVIVFIMLTQRHHLITKTF